MDSFDFYFIGFIVDKQFPETGSNCLKLFGCWLAIIEVKTILGVKTLWNLIISAYPFINNFIRKKICFSISKE